MTNFQEIDMECMANFPWPANDAHKHSRGRLAVFSGPKLNTGAARLAALAGARIGAGWVKVFAPKDAANIIAYHQTSIMVGEYEFGDILSDEILSFDCAIIGMGFGTSSRHLATLERLLNSDLPLIIDADAISLIAANLEELSPILLARKAKTILTPHSAEFARILGRKPSENIDKRGEEALEIAHKLNSYIVLKGPETIIAAPNGDCAINRISTPWLATAGTGDVLAGMIGGLLAQKLGAMDAAKIATFLHSQTAINIGAGMIAEDLAQNFGVVINEYAPHNLKSGRNKSSKPIIGH